MVTIYLLIRGRGNTYSYKYCDRDVMGNLFGQKIGNNNVLHFMIFC